MSAEPVAAGVAALAEGRWSEARDAFEIALANGETAEACFGLSTALWWLGDNHACVAWCTRAYALFRRSGDVEGAAQCAVWLAITYKANFGNAAAANGWISRAERLLEPLDRGPLHGWVAVARAYRSTDLHAAEELTEQAADVARAAGDIDLELVALAQLGLIRVAKGERDAGFRLIDEAMAAALAGERHSLDTVVYTCCDMLNACELASDMERATQWCQVADDFVATYGCPFLYAECRIYYGSVLTTAGRWADADRELRAGVTLTAGASPGLHRRAVARLAGLRVRQGRLEEAERLVSELDEGIEAEAETTLLTAAVLLARGDAAATSRLLEQRLRQLADHRSHLATALHMLVDAYLGADDIEAAVAASQRLDATAESATSDHLAALATEARGRVLVACGDARGVTMLEGALEAWASLRLPLQTARARFELARSLAASAPDSSVDHARRALAVFDELGASIDADRVAAFLRSVGIVPRTGPKRADVLTVREREVLRLLGAGLSNPEIAVRLHVSRKTASHHVSHIFTKLGLRNRAEAAACADAVLAEDAPTPSRT